MGVKQRIHAEILKVTESYKRILKMDDDDLECIMSKIKNMLGDDDINVHQLSVHVDNFKQVNINKSMSKLSFRVEISTLNKLLGEK